MWDVEEIAGAFFRQVEQKSWRCRASQLSSDGNTLCRLYQVSDGTFRVQRFERRPGAPQWRGEWWEPIEGPSITDTFAHAERLASQFLNAEQRS
jgi:hypothetical protein